MSDYTPTPAEVADWRILRDRAYRDGGDNAPMRHVSYAARPGSFTERMERVIPWLQALNMEVE